MGILKAYYDKWIRDLVIKSAVGGVAEFLNGKKTAVGAVSLLLWSVIYAAPVVVPDFPLVVTIGLSVKEALEAAGVSLDSELLGGGVALTVTGLIHKLMKWVKEWQS